MHHPGVHDTILVALSILIASFASYTALDLATRMRRASGWACHAWLGAAALAMGGGIWSMHFVAMLAFSLPGMEVGYDLGLTTASLLLAVAATAVGFEIVGSKSTGALPLLSSGLIVGLGIAGMHYTGMAAMRMPADLQNDHLWVAIAVLIAIGAAVTALWLTFRHTGSLQRLLASIVMGVAVSGMHYAAMQGAVFTPRTGLTRATADASVGQAVLALWVTGTTFLILFLALIAAMFDRHFARITEREAQALRHSEEQFRLLLRSVTDYAIFMLDRDGCVASWNAGAQRFSGYEERDIVGSPLSRFYTADARQAGEPQRALDVALKDGKFEEEGWRVRKNGQPFWASAVIEIIRDDDGEPLGFASVTRDITDRKQAEEALERARAALAETQKMEALGQLTGGMAHDFNDLLMAVLGSLELLRKRLPADPKVERLLDNAMKGAERGVALTQRMLSFARRQDLSPTAVQVPDLVQGMSDLLNQSIGPAISIETRFALELPPVLVDAHQLELALLNLALNARDAMPNGGTITIAAEKEPLSGDGEPLGYVRLTVTDTGEGMAADTLSRAQEPFFTTKGLGKGTGLGLSMVRGLAEQSNGRLVLRSEKGDGTSVELWLPIAEVSWPQVKPGSLAVRPREEIRPLTILVVDDDPLVLENTAAMLEDLGHHVIEARSGNEALELLHGAQTLDLVITDQVMPGMTGTALADRIRSERPELRLLLASGYTDLPLGAGLMMPKLRKPFDLSTLARSIAEVMQDQSPPYNIIQLRSGRD